MKILYVATVLSHICQFHLPYLQMLQEQGHEVHVAAHDNLAVKNGLQLKYADRHIEIPFERSPYDPRNIKAYKKLETLLDKEHYDLIVCNTPVGGILTRLAARKDRKHGTRVIYIAHGFHFYKGASKKNWAMFYPLEKEMARMCDAVVTINEEDYWINENRLQILVDFLEQHPEYSRVSHRREIVDENGTRRGYDLPESRLNRAFTIDDYMQGWVYGDFCSLFRNYYREAGNRFNSLFLASRNVCDFQDMFITQEFGPVYILGDCLAAYRSRSTQGETNYNSITSQIERCKDHIHIAETLEAFFRGKYDLSPYKTFNRTRIVNERITAGDAANFKADLAAIAAPERIRILTEQLYLRLRARNKSEARFILKNNALGDNVRVFLSLPLYLVKRVVGRARKTNGPQTLKGYVRA